MGGVGGDGGQAGTGGHAGTGGVGGIGGDGDGGIGGEGGAIPDGAWGTPESIGGTEKGGSNPQVALDPNGNAISVWQRQDVFRSDVWANRFTVNSGWGTPGLIETDDQNHALNPQVAVEADGDAITVWSLQSNGIRSNRFTPLGGWETAELISAYPMGGGFLPRVAIDPQGNAVAVWEEWDGSNGNIWFNRYTAIADWGVAGLAETGRGRASRPQVGMDAGGHAIAVWQQFDTLRVAIWASRLTPNGSWGPIERIDLDNLRDASDPQLAVDPSGNAVAVWEQRAGVTYPTIWANRFSPNDGWGTAEVIQRTTASAVDPQVAIDASGNAVAVWIQSEGMGSIIAASRFTPTTGWVTARRISAADSTSVHNPQIAMDPDGNAMAVWERHETVTGSVMSNRFRSSTGWGTAQPISASDWGGSPQVAMDAGGNAIAVWTETPGPVANRFVYSGGMGGSGGTGGTDYCQGVDCDDQNECTDNTCDAANGKCESAPVAEGSQCGQGGGICQDGACTSVFACTEDGIRDAIALGGGPHTFTCALPTRVRTNAEIIIDNDVILDGEHNLIVDGNDDHRVFRVEREVTTEMRRLTVTGGRSFGDEFRGSGGIFNEGVLTITESTLSKNRSEFGAGGIGNVDLLLLIDSVVSENVAGTMGGGIQNRGETGTVRLINTTVTDNTAANQAGGIHNDFQGRMELVESRVANNTGGGVRNDAFLTMIRSTVADNAGHFGGGVRNSGATMSLIDCSVSGNTGTGGGGIYSSMPVTLRNSTVSGNTATNFGGGLAVMGGSATLINSTVSNNSVAGAQSSGGGIFAHAPVVLISATLSGNIASSATAIQSSGAVSFANSIVDGTCTIMVEPPEDPPDAGVPGSVSKGGNIESPGDTCGLEPLSDRVGVTSLELNLGPLQDNGGPTLTQAPGAGSAIDVIEVEDCVDADGLRLLTDQRGVTRPQGPKCDVGAVEVGP